jgi:HlyD family secretion protein
VTICTRFGILRVGSLLAGSLLALLTAGCGPAFLGEVPRPSEGAKPTAHSDAKAAGDASAKGDKEDIAHDKDKTAKKEDAKAEAGDEKKDEKEDKKEEKKDAKDEEKIAGHVDVRCVTARRLPFAITVDGLGRTEPLPECVGSLTAAVEGHVHDLLVKIGDPVKARQAILQLDPTVAKATLAEKEANRDSLVAALKLLQSLPRPVETKAAELAVEQAKIAVEHDQSQIESLRPLLPHNEVSPKVFHDAEVALKQAQVLLQTAQAQLLLMMSGPRPEAVAEGQTKIAMAEQAVASSRETLALHTLRAPIAGVVESLNCHPGQTLTIGTSVGEVIDLRRLFVTVYFPARVTRLLQPGMVARVDLSDGAHPASESDAKDVISGKVSFIGSAADPQTGNYAVRILMENNGMRLRSGQVVKAIVVLKNEEPQIAVPEAAIFDQGEGPLLAVVREGKIKLLHPELGATDGGNVAVAKTDLKEGEPVVVEGAYGVADDTEAKVLPAESKDKGESKDAAESKDKGEPKGKDESKDKDESKGAPESKDKAEPKGAAKAGGHE